MPDLSNQTVIHVKKETVEYLQFRKLLEYSDSIQHCYTLSKKNIDFRNNAELQSHKESIKETYQKICNSLGLEDNHIVRPYQTHTNIVKNVEEPITQYSIAPKEYTNVDGLITNQKQTILSLTYADCIALLFFDPVQKVIANIHSGWQGTVQRIAQNAVSGMMEKYHSKPQDIIGCICPSIRKCHFEVDEDVKEVFEKEFSEMSSFIEKGEVKQGKQKYYIDTVLLNKNMLKNMGLQEKNIVDSGICTTCHCDSFHSYRATKQNARNTAIITLL